MPLPGSGEVGMARTARYRRSIGAVCALIFGCLQLSPAASQTADQLLEFSGTNAQEPITPVPEPAAADPRKIALGERLFGDTRLSRDNSHSCASCHDLSSNGASKNSHDVGLNGAVLPLNTLTVFNAALSFRLGWEGKSRTLEAHTTGSLESPRILDISVSKAVEKLSADAAMRREFVAAYDRGPDAANVLDAIASFERTLITPGSRFDRWLKGDATALSAEELEIGRAHV